MRMWIKLIEKRRRTYAYFPLQPPYPDLCLTEKIHEALTSRVNAWEYLGFCLEIGKVTHVPRTFYRTVSIRSVPCGSSGTVHVKISVNINEEK